MLGANHKGMNTLLTRPKGKKEHLKPWLLSQLGGTWIPPCTREIQLAVYLLLLLTGALATPSTAQTKRIIVSTTRVDVKEGDNTDFWVRLATIPTGAVTVAITGHMSTSVTLDATSLDFSPSDWNMRKTVTVSAVNDDNELLDEIVTLTLSASGGGYDAQTKSITIYALDDDSQTGQIILSPRDITMIEGGTAMQRLRLAVPPTGSMEVDIPQPGRGLTHRTPNPEFDTSDWNRWVTITWTAAEDDNATDNEFTAFFVGIGENYEGSSRISRITVVDNDRQQIVLSPSSLTIDEGGSGSYNVKLGTEPLPTAEAVVVDITGFVGTDIMLDKTSLTFTTSDWSAAQMVSVTASHDSNRIPEAAVALIHSASGSDYSGVMGEVEVSVKEDAFALVINTAGLTVTEGGNANYTLKLAARPTATVTVDIAGYSGTDVTPVPASLTFNVAGNNIWSTAQMVSVSAVHDDDATPDPAVTLTHTAAGGRYGGLTGEVEVSITEDDEAALIFDKVDLSITEGGNGTYSVKLASEPTATVTVTITGHATTNLTVNPTSLTFTADAANIWSTAQIVTVSTDHDNDATPDPAVTLTHTAAGGDYGDETEEVEVTIVEDDEVALVLNKNELSVTEGGNSTYSVKLASEPTATVTVTITGQATTDVMPVPTSLTFNVSGANIWSTAQTVTVTANHDNDATPDPAVTLTHTAAGGDYGDETEEVEVTIIEDDEAALVLNKNELSVTEGGNSTYSVKLASEPTATVTVTITGQATTDVMPVPTSLTFNVSGANIWSTAQTVTVSADHDNDATPDPAVTLTHTAAGGDYGDETEEVEVTIIEDDEVALVLNKSELSVTEGDNSTYSVKLASEPTATVTVTITGQATTDLTVNPTSLTFTTGGANIWNTAQMVTVSANHDHDGAADDAVTLQHTASGGDYGDATSEVEVTIVEDDVLGLVLSNKSLSITEGDDETYTVRLGTEPNAAVTVAITGQSSTDISLIPASLTFNVSGPNIWSTAQTVTVSANEDDDAATDAAVTLSHTASGGDYAGKVSQIEVTITENDKIELVIDKEMLTVAEGGDATYTVKLGSTPTDMVTVAITGQSGTDVSPDLATLTFMPSGANIWSTAQTVTVSANEDDDAVTDAVVTLAHTASGGGYANVTDEVDVTITENDEIALIFSKNKITVDEGGRATYTVRLASKPTAHSTLILSNFAGTDINVVPRTMDFLLPLQPWDEEKTVTVTARNDDDATSDATVTLLHRMWGEVGSNYRGVVTGKVEVTIIEDDSPELVLSTEDLTITEGGSKAYTIKLATKPTAAVTVAISGHSSTDVSPDPASLTFTPSGTTIWSTAQTVIVSASKDSDSATDAAVTLLHTASGGDYMDETGEVEVIILETDGVELVFNKEELTIAEGGNGNYTVKLSAEPAATVIVAISGHSSTDVSPDPASLTFTPTGAKIWNRAQTVHVDAGEDHDAVADEEVTLLHTASGGNFEGKVGQVEVTIIENDIAELVVSPELATITEGSSGNCTVRLASEPTATVTVTISGHIGTDIMPDPISLTFEKSGAKIWSTAQTVTMTANQDDDAATDAAVTLLHTASGGDYAGEASEVEVTITEDDEVALVVSPESVTITEGGSGTYTVKLATEPTASVTVTVTGQAETDLTLDPASLTFEAAGGRIWSTAQTVIVSAGEDDDATNDAAILTLTATGGGYRTVKAEVPVNTTDVDETGIVLSASTLAVAEEGSNRYTVALLTQPTAPVTVSVTGHAGTDLTLDKTSLTFTTVNWGSVQTVTVSAGDDDDTMADTATLTHTATGGDYAAVKGEVVVNTTDNDTPGLLIDPTALTVEEGKSTSYTVVLATQPAVTVTVAITGHGNTDVTLDKTSLTFTTANWRNPQDVTVSAGHDGDGADDTVTLTHKASGGDYGTVQGAVELRVTDDDTASLVFAPQAVALTEGSVAGYTVALLTAPTAVVQVSITGHAQSGLTLDRTQLTFTPTNWRVVQAVQIAAEHDNDSANEEIGLLHSATGGNYTRATGTVEVSITDDDAEALVILPQLLSLTEGGSGSFTVALSTLPSVEVEVQITGHEENGLTLDRTQLTFTPSTWSEPQSVVMEADQDDDANDVEVELLLSATGGNYTAVTVSATVSVTDDDTPTLEILPQVLSVSEGSNGSYTVALSTLPSAQVEVTITGHEGSGLALDRTQLTFTPSTWNEPQLVVMEAREDDDGLDGVITLVHEASGGGYAFVTSEVPVRIIDGDAAALVLQPSSLSVVEGGSGSYTVVLATLPSARVEVDITGHAENGLMLDMTSLTFTTANWSEAQTVRVDAGEDEDGLVNEVTLVHTAGGGDYAEIQAELTVSVADNDAVGMVLNPSALSVMEGGSSSYTVALTTAPTGQVEVDIAGHAESGLTLDMARLVFTQSNWSKPQTVRVDAGEDDDVVDNTATLTHTASGGGYGGVSGELAIDITDNDVANLVLNPLALSVMEEESSSYTVKLSTRPSGEVKVSITGQEESGLTLGAATLTFTETDWDTPQTVSVEAQEDEDGADEAAVLTHTASGGGYDAVTASLTVTTTDDDAAGLVIAPAALSVREGESSSYTVKLAIRPSGEVKVTITGQELSSLVLDAAILAFTPADWDTPQTVRVEAQEDWDAADGTATLTHTASGGGYDAVTASLPVATTDNDSAGLEIDPARLTVQEGESVRYTVALETQPTGPVEVTITGHEETDLTLDAMELTFTASDWDNPQTIRVGAQEDDDAADDTATLTHTASGGGYDAVIASVPVTTTDNETGGLALDPAALSLQEGQTVRYTVALETQPTGPVEVTITGHEETDLVPDARVLTFTPTDWDTPQTVTIDADDDDDATDDTATLIHTASGGGYDADASLTVMTIDDDTRGLVIIPQALSLDAGTSTTYGVALETQPAGAVTVEITGSLGLDRSLLTFAETNWNEPQAVVVSAGDNIGTKVLLHTASGADYHAVTKEMVVTIRDGAFLPASWLARFGRTVAEQALDAVGERMEAPRTGGSVSGVVPSVYDRQGYTGPFAVPWQGWNRYGGYGELRRRDVLSSVTGVMPAGGGSMAFWGRSAHTTFEGQEASMQLEGTVISSILGSDYARGRWLLGAAVVYSQGEGGFAGDEKSGDTSSSVAAAIPYASYRVGNRQAVWAATGYGIGKYMSEVSTGGRARADTDWSLAAVGQNFSLLRPGSRAQVTLIADALWSRITSDATQDMAPSAAEMTRLRLGLEGGWTAVLGSSNITPVVEVGLRHDGGDAEIGLGVEVGGGMGWTHRQMGLFLDLSGRTLLSHAASGRTGQTFSATLGFDPRPETDRGLSVDVRQDRSSGLLNGSSTLFSHDPFSHAHAYNTSGRWTTEAGYGLPAFGNRLTGTPHVGFSTSDYSRNYSVGWRISAQTPIPGFSVGITTIRRNSDFGQPEYSIGFNARAQW